MEYWVAEDDWYNWCGDYYDDDTSKCDYEWYWDDCYYAEYRYPCDTDYDYYGTWN